MKKMRKITRNPKKNRNEQIKKGKRETKKIWNNERT